MEEEDLTSCAAPPLSPVTSSLPGSPPPVASRAVRAVLTPLDLGEIDCDAPLDLGPQARAPWRLAHFLRRLKP
jgi:hypothetical protein